MFSSVTGPILSTLSHSHRGLTVDNGHYHEVITVKNGGASNSTSNTSPVIQLWMLKRGDDKLISLGPFSTCVRVSLSLSLTTPKRPNVSADEDVMCNFTLLINAT